MRDLKIRVEEFALFDYSGVEKHLEKMAAKGWRLSEIVGNLWIYKRMNPANIKYAVTYIPSASPYDPVETDETARLNDYCESAGWRKVTDWLQMQIYCTDDLYAKPLETDEAVRLDVIRRAMRKTYVLSHVLLILVFLLNGYSIGTSYKLDPVGFLAQNYNLYLLVIGISGLMQIFFNLTYLALWIRKSKKSVEAGGTCAPVRYYRIISKASLAGVSALLVLMIYSAGDGLGLVILLGFGGFWLLAYMLQITRIIMRNRGVEKSTNISITIVVDIILAIALVAGIYWGTSQYIEHRGVPDDTYFAKGTWWDIYYDNIPVRIEDLIETQHKHFSYEMEEKNSFLLSYKSCEQTAVPYGSNGPYLWYEVWHVKYDSMYDWCLKHFLKKYDYLIDNINERLPGDGIENQYGFVLVEPYDWHSGEEYAEDAKADKIYRNYYVGEAGNEWIICKDNMIISVQSSWELTDEQMKNLVIGVSRYQPIKYEFDVENMEVLVDEKTYQFADGTYAYCWENSSFEYIVYRLEDGTELLNISDKMLFYRKKEETSNGGEEEMPSDHLNDIEIKDSWNALGLYNIEGLDVDAKAAVCTYIEKLEAGYDIKLLLENAYADYLNCRAVTKGETTPEMESIASDFQTHSVWKDIYCSIDQDNYFSYLITVYMPKGNHNTGQITDHRKIYYFDKQSGRKMEPSEFFTVSEDEACTYLINLCDAKGLASREQIEKYLSLDYLYFRDMEDGMWSSDIEIYFPAGTISENMIGVDVDYDDLEEILQPWVMGGL